MRMIDIGEKAATLREAEAEAILRGDPQVLHALWTGKLPKGEARAAAQVAGMLAAKRTPELLPMCHPIRIDNIEVNLSLEGDQLVIRARARTHDRTGVEMEALTAASIAALTLYDWAKAHDPSMEFTVRLIRKSGGKSGAWERMPSLQEPLSHPLKGVRAAVLTISDRASQGIYSDESGPLIQQWLQQQGAELVAYALVPDERDQISAELIRLTDTFLPDLLLTTGGTGLAPRDDTPEATRAVLEREMPSIAEWLRLRTSISTPLAYLSRATAGVRGRTLIINLPGSPRAVWEHLEALLPLLPHALEMVRGATHAQGGCSNG
ncbi:Molybdopterin adenylyltransferase [bacterium HR15]|nr:Molybdopterin adenylyltransferase [bacterium HR15]